MKPTTRYWREKDLELLRSFKTEARKQAWRLKKDGYIVDFYDRYRKRGWGKLEYSEIYNWEKIVVYEYDGSMWNEIIDDMSYDSLTRFYRLAQDYKRKHGKKQLHNFTDEILEKTIR